MGSRLMCNHPHDCGSVDTNYTRSASGGSAKGYDLHKALLRQSV
jgi:hypothetical protein